MAALHFQCLAFLEQKLQAMLRVFLFFLLLPAASFALIDVPRPFSQALTAMAAEKWDLALRFAAKEGPVARDVIEWHLHRAGKGTAPAALSFLKRRPDWPGLPYLRKNAEASFADASPEQVLAFFQQTAAQTAQGALIHARALEAMNRPETARLVVQDAWLGLSMSKAVQARFLTRYQADLSGLHVSRLRWLLWHNHISQARNMLALVPKPEAALARARLALMQQQPGVDGLIARVPKSLQSDPLLVHARFEWRARKGRADAALTLILEQSSSAKALGYPSAWAERRRHLARDLLRKGAYMNAYKIAAQHHLSAGSKKAELDWLAGYTALKFLEKPAAAEKHFKDFLTSVETPISLARGHYWLALAQSQMGRKQAMAENIKRAASYPTTFYGLLSAELAGRALNAPDFARSALPDWRGASFQGSSVFQASIVLFAAQQDLLAERFLAHMAETLPDPQILYLADFLEELEKPRVLVMLGKRAASQGRYFPRPTFALHPLSDLVVAGSSGELALAIARQETEFRTGVVSPVGALGMMQVMPLTGREMARKLGLRYRSARARDDWPYNVRLGSAYLAELNKKYDGNIVLVAAAYNAGPGRVDAWIRASGDPRNPRQDIVDWIEMIPFQETRNYVMRVTESLPVYRARLGKTPLPQAFLAQLSGHGF